MKVIFLEDVPNVGRAGESGEVADGYGRNYLLPQKLAVLADSRASNLVAAQLKKIAHRRALVEAEMKQLAEEAKIEDTEKPEASEAVSEEASEEESEAESIQERLEEKQ